MRAQNPGATLEGIVQDTQGSRIPLARIELRALESSSERQATADTRGEFRLDDLQPGDYHVIVNASGFSEARSDVAVAVGSARDVTVIMRPSAERQIVNVQGEASSITSQPIDTTTTVEGGVVTAQDLQTIPLAERTFANISYLVPGTEPVEPSDPTKARITAVSTGGSSGLNDQLSVDGGDNSDDYIGGFLQNFSTDAIEEFAVRTAQDEADTGRTTAGSVVITTRRGTDNWHGDAAFYERSASLNARFPIENPGPTPSSRSRGRTTSGRSAGPSRRANFGSFRPSKRCTKAPASPTVPPLEPSSTRWPHLPLKDRFPESARSRCRTTSRFHSAITWIPFRLDWSQSQRSQWFWRSSGDNYTTDNDLIQQGTLPNTGVTSGSNYLNSVLSNQYSFSPTWFGSFTFDASALRRTESRNDYLGLALAFPFSSTFLTISGFETFGDNQFVTPITAFPVSRKQEKYQFRYDVSHASGGNAPRFGIDFIHEPVLSGALSGTAENLTVFTMDPGFYLANPAQFSADLNCAPSALSGTTCTPTPASNGSFSQNVQRLGVYAENGWRETPRLTINYGVRYDTTFGLFEASGRSQAENPAVLTLEALKIPLANGVPRDYRGAIAPRIGIAYSPGKSLSTVVRAGFGLFYNDLAQTGWVTALQAVNAPSGPCVNAGDPACLPGGAAGSIIDPHYKTPYAIHITGGVQHAFSPNWSLSVDYNHEQGVHSFARYQYQAGYTLFNPFYPASDMADQLATIPNTTDFRSDNRSSYNGMSAHLQGNVTRRFNLIVNYTLSKASTWGCVLGELFDYVDGVCNPLHAFGKGDYGPSGEDVTDRFVFAGIFHLPGGFDVSTLGQAESARPITLTTPVDVNGFGDPLDDRAVVNGAQTSLDQFRGTPYMQVDMRVSRPFTYHERWSVNPFVEFFNVFNRNNPGANYITNIAALPTPVNNLANATAFCLNAACSETQPITSPNQLRVPAGALGDFFGPGTTVGIPFAAQLGVRVTF